MSTFNISGQHLEITPALDEYTREKLSKVTQIFENTTSIHVVLRVDGGMQKAEAKVKLAGDQNNIFAEAATEDMYKSIDELEQKLVKQVKKYHDKIKDHHKDK